MVLNMLVVMDDGTSCLHDNHLATLMATREESMALLRNVFKTEEMFLDMFEDEYREMSVSGHGNEMSSFSWDTTASKRSVSITVVISLVADKLCCLLSALTQEKLLCVHNVDKNYLVFFRQSWQSIICWYI